MGMIYLVTVILPAAFLLRQAMDKLIIVSERRWKRVLLLFGCWLLLGMKIYMGDPTNILWTIFGFLSVIQIVCEGGFWKKITIGLIFSSTVFAFSALRDNYLIYPRRLLYEPGRSMLLASLITLVFSSLLYTGIRKAAPDREYRLSDSMWKLLLLLTMTPVGIVLSVVLLYDMYQGNRLDDVFGDGFAALLVIALFSIIGLLWTVTVLAKQQKLEQQSMLAEINRNYYESMEQQHFAIRRLKHDLANHLAALTAMPEERRESYIRSLAEDSTVIRSLQYCGDVTVNAVLSVKEEQMKRYGIRLEIKIEIPEELPFEKTDVCALYANALDNAAEACMKLGTDQRKVLLKSKAQKGLFCLEVRNPAADAENPEGNMTFPQTSKKDKENHGIGLRSMKEIVERYHGAMDLRTDGEVFELFLYMPLG